MKNLFVTRNGIKVNICFCKLTFFSWKNQKVKKSLKWIKSLKKSLCIKYYLLRTEWKLIDFLLGHKELVFLQSDAVLKSYNNGLRLRLKISFRRKVKFGISTKYRKWLVTTQYLYKFNETLRKLSRFRLVECFGSLCQNGLLKRKRGLHSNWWMTLISLSSRGFETGWSCSGLGPCMTRLCCWMRYLDIRKT